MELVLLGMLTGFVLRRIRWRDLYWNVYDFFDAYGSRSRWTTVYGLQGQVRRDGEHVVVGTPRPLADDFKASHE